MDFPTKEKLTSSSSSTCHWNYDIFLSFRGEDTRYGFTGHLYTALCDNGLITFIDNNLQRGEEISMELFKTIEMSMISIVVFSENYASSTWCLDELVKILECKNTGRIRKVYPIFYKVNPSEIRKHEGKFGMALDKHEKKFRYDMEKVTRWRDTLTQVANLSGYEYKNGCNEYEYEYEFIQRIIKEISSIKSNQMQLPIAKYPVGVEPQAEAIESLLDMESNGVCMVGIHGLGGVGKTTISIAVYNRIVDRFEGSCFLENIREKSKTDVGITQLQETLLSKILRGRNDKVTSVREGITMIKERLRSKKVLLILDDVDQLEEIENLLGDCNWFALGSKVIITTRDKEILSNLGRDSQIRTYEVKKLTPREARVLFNMHAFGQNEPKQEYSNLAEHIISSADGLPLALKIMGSDLYDKTIDEWACASEKYKKIPHEKILDKLKISYYGLGEVEKDIFLDIACFFKGFKKDEVVNILNACKLYPNLGIKKLIDKCLITVDLYGILCMHDLLQQMGGEIVQQESKELENRSRIWYHEDSYKLLTENMGSNKIRGLMWHSPKPRMVNLQANTFKKMRNLKFLLVENVQICKQLKYLPNELRLLQWPEYNFSLPIEFYPQNLVVLNMPNSKIGPEKLFKPDCVFENLKTINFRECKSIAKLPYLWAPNLKTLDISGCENLIEVHESVGNLDKLEIWNLHCCIKLEILPSRLMLRSLKSFDLRYCQRLEKFPDIHPEMKCLEDLFMTNSGIREWPLSLTHLTKRLIHLGLSNNEQLGNFLDSPNKLQLVEEIDIPTANSFDGFLCLRDLHLNYCDELYFHYFPQLGCLHLCDSNIVSIPESISRFPKLEKIYIRNCKQLRQIPMLPQSVRHVEVKQCPSLDPQSSSRLLNQFGEILGILPNRVHEGAGSNMLIQFSDSEPDYFVLPGTEIPDCLKFNHQSFGNSLSFWVGQNFPKIAVCIAFRSAEPCLDKICCCVKISINGCKQEFNCLCIEESSEELWLFSKSLGQSNKPNLSEQNHIEVEVICKIKGLNNSCCDLKLGNHTDFIKWFGVNVECTCFLQNPDIICLPLPSAVNGCGSSSILNDTDFCCFEKARDLCC